MEGQWNWSKNVVSTLCNLKINFLILKQTLMAMAVSGHNGNNETKMGMSTSIGLSFYDKNMKEIEIINTQSPIELIIKRDQNIPDYDFQYVNISDIKLTDIYLQNAFNLTANNASIHIELKPLNYSLGYLLVMKLGYPPIFNSTYTDFTSYKIFCPSNSSFIK